MNLEEKITRIISGANPGLLILHRQTAREIMELLRNEIGVCPHDCDYCHGDDCPCDRLGCGYTDD